MEGDHKQICEMEPLLTLSMLQMRYLTYNALKKLTTHIDGYGFSTAIIQLLCSSHC
jgi:hypothetical protein